MSAPKASKIPTWRIFTEIVRFNAGKPIPLTGFAVIAATLLVWWVLGTSQSFQDCEHQAKHQNRYKALYDKPSVFFVKLSRAAARLRIHVSCGAQEADIHQGGIIALFTVTLAISTFLLWIDTRRLAKGAEAQSKDMQDSILQASLAAKAMARSASGTWEAVESSRSSDRAWLIMSDTQNGSVKEYRDRDGVERFNGYLIRAIWRNYGRTPATNVALTVDYRILDDGVSFPEFPERMFKNEHALIGPSASGRSDSIIIREEFIPDLRAGKKRLYIYSRVDYKDIFHTETWRVSETMFSFVFSGRRQSAGKMEDDIGKFPIGPQNRCT